MTVMRATGQVPEATAPQPQKNPHAVALGRLGDQKGGKTRARKLNARSLPRSPERPLRPDGAGQGLREQDTLTS
jgi:hypothetical protein